MDGSLFRYTFPDTPPHLLCATCEWLHRGGFYPDSCLLDGHRTTGLDGCEDHSYKGTGMKEPSDGKADPTGR